MLGEASTFGWVGAGLMLGAGVLGAGVEGLVKAATLLFGTGAVMLEPGATGGADGSMRRGAVLEATFEAGEPLLTPPGTRKGFCV